MKRVIGKKILGLSLVGSALHLVGCSASTEGGDDSGSTALGVDRSKSVDDLDAAETRAVCAGIIEYIADFDADAAYQKGTCVAFVATESESIEECEEWAASCEYDSPIIPDVDAAVEHCAAAFDAEGCQATIGDLQACMDQDMSERQKLREITSCADAFARADELRTLLEPHGACAPLASEECSNMDLGLDDESMVAIQGTVDGKEFVVNVEEVAGSSELLGGDTWELSATYDDTFLWLWQAPDAIEGFVLAPTDSGTAAICLGDVSYSRADGTGNWSSSELSLLDCSPGRESLALAPAQSDVEGGSVEGTVLGEPVHWNNYGFSCGGESCELLFKDDAGVEWGLLVGVQIQPGPAQTFSSSSLVRHGGPLAMACGGSGTVKVTSDWEFTVQIDNLGPLQACPGDAVEGELVGSIDGSL